MSQLFDSQLRNNFFRKNSIKLTKFNICCQSFQAHRDIPTPGLGPIARPRSYSTSTANSDSLLSSYLEKNGPLKNNTSSLFGGTSSPLFANLRDSGFNVNAFYNDSLDAVLNQTLDDLNLDDIHMEASLEKDFIGSNVGDNHDNNAMNAVNSVLHRSSLLGSTAPVNIPGLFAIIITFN